MSQKRYLPKNRLPFRSWLYRYRDEPGAMGDIARLIMVDAASGCLPSIRYVSHCTSYVSHFKDEHDAPSAVLYAIRDAWARYEQEVSRHD